MGLVKRVVNGRARGVRNPGFVGILSKFLLGNGFWDALRRYVSVLHEQVGLAFVIKLDAIIVIGLRRSSF